jgi:hypothetical protein
VSTTVARSATDPFRWWHQDGWQPPVITDLLYRTDQWVTTFLTHLDAELVRRKLATAYLETDRSALVVTGPADPGTLRMARARYRDIVLFHPTLHRDVEAKVEAAVVAAATECAGRGFRKADVLRSEGREALRRDRGILLHPDVTAGLEGLGLTGLPPLGISGVVEVRSSDGTYVVASLRSDRVAVNPGCLGPAIDGGLGWTPAGVDPQAGLLNESRAELPWGFGRDDLELVGTVLPPAQPTRVAGAATRRCGVNIVFRASIDREIDEVFRAAPKHFEARELMLVETVPRASPTGFPAVWARQRDQLVEVTEVPPLSEVLVSALARRDLVHVSLGKAPRRRAPRSSPRRTREASVMRNNSTETADLTLDDTWAKDLIERHSRLSRLLHPDKLADLGETEETPSMDDLGPVVDAVREFEFVKTAEQIKASDDARLFEALVYRVGRYLFGNNQRQALAAHDVMLPRDKSLPLADGEDPNPIGTAYTRRLSEVIELDREEDPQGVWRDQVAEALVTLNQNEAVQEYAEVARRGRLLCFCAALWALETNGDPRAATVALDDRYRKSLSGEVIALFFRARALLTSPVISAAQAQLGLQFVTTALAVYDHNPGMHHTKAIFLLRQSALTEIEAVSISCLDQALQSVETALEWDAEFPKFYATRAKVKYRLRDRPGALIDIRAAIELARYSETSPVVQKEVDDWESLLEGWQLTPVGATPA